MSEELEYSEEQKRLLAKIGCLGYSRGNYLPDSCTWTLYKTDIIEIVKRTASAYIKDIDSVSLGFTGISYTENNRLKSKDVPCAFIWIKSDSNQLVDKSLYNTNVAVPFSRKAKDPDLLEFAKKFCKNGKAELVGTRSGKLTGLIAMLLNIVMLEFDEKNFEYAQKFGREFTRNANIKMNWVKVPIPDSKYDYDVEKITVIKEVVRKKFEVKENRPKNSYNARY